jgi:drug/metabolite transporter (DMT)-like permease
MPLLSKSDDRAAAILLIVASCAVFGALDGIGKYLAADYHIVQIVWARYATFLPAALLLLGRRRWQDVWRAGRPGFQSARALLPPLAGGAIVLGAARMPLADATAIQFVAPLLVVGLSIPLLGERVQWWKWAAAGVGFIGVLVIARPGAGGVGWAMLLPLTTALLSALHQIATRWLGAIDPRITLLYTAVIGFAVTTAAAPFFWTPPSVAGWALFALSGIMYGVAHYCMILAYARAPASDLAPVSYVQIVAATIFGFLVFGDLPDRATFAGALLIVGAGLYVLVRETRLQRRPAAALSECRGSGPG